MSIQKTNFIKCISSSMISEISLVYGIICVYVSSCWSSIYVQFIYFLISSCINSNMYKVKNRVGVFFSMKVSLIFFHVNLKMFLNERRKA